MHSGVIVDADHQILSQRLGRQAGQTAASAVAATGERGPAALGGVVGVEISGRQHDTSVPQAAGAQPGSRSPTQGFPVLGVAGSGGHGKRMYYFSFTWTADGHLKSVFGPGAFLPNRGLRAAAGSFLKSVQQLSEHMAIR